MAGAAALAGRVFGEMEALGRDGTDKGGNATWRCLCLACGTEKPGVRGTALAHGQVRSCGCRRRRAGDARSPRLAPEAMKDETFGKLVCREMLPAEKPNDGKRWFCDCLVCGGWTLARAKDLRNGNTKSCGCLAGRKNRAPRPPAMPVPQRPGTDGNTDRPGPSAETSAG